MSRTKRPKPLYQRGAYSLHRRDGRKNLEIIWYDVERRRERSTSAGTSDVGQGRAALDKLYLANNGHEFCPSCGRVMSGEAAPLATRVIMDYLLDSEGKAGEKSAKTRLSHLVGYIASTDPTLTLPMVTERWINGFRGYMKRKGYAPGHTEGCVLQFAAAINSVRGHQAQFKAQSLKAVARSPVYRADIETLAAMFRFCIDPPPPEGREWSDKERTMVRATRSNLLLYLRAAVSTWARPDAIFDIRAKGQWHRAAGVLDLNPPGREQTKKHRPVVPVPAQFAPCLDEALEREHYLPVSTVRHGWKAMRDYLQLPGGRESGEKLIRRSVSTLARSIIGEERWAQGECMLGHRRSTISDIYAIRNPANLGVALKATESIIDDIERLCPGAFTAPLPQMPAQKESERRPK
jgi:hypothetical protein